MNDTLQGDGNSLSINRALTLSLLQIRINDTP